MEPPQTNTVTLKDILITEELSQRSPRSPNWQAEAQAMGTLARQMARDSDLMQTLVDTALELCQAGTTGVSLLETTPDGEEIFRWTVLAGRLAHHVGGSTPRNFSPCGVCLERGTPVLFSHPERYFTYFQAANTPIVEGLVLPLIAEDRAIGTIWIMSHDREQHFDSEDVRVMMGLADFAAAAHLVNQRQTRELLAANATKTAEIVERKQAEERLRGIIENLPGGAAFVVDRDLRYLLAEGEALSLAGFQPSDLVGRTIFEVLPPELAAYYEVLYRQALAGESFEHEHNAHDRWYISRGTPLYAPDGEVDAVLAVSYDISDRKLAEAAVAADLKDTQLLHELSARLVTEGDIQTLYQEIVTAAVDLMQSDAGTIQILEEETQVILLLASQGLEQKTVEYFYRINASSNTACGIALATRKRAIINYDVPKSEDPDGSLQKLVEAGFLCGQSTPLISRSGKAIGMISTHWRKHHRPTERELRFLDLLARQAADLIEQWQAQATLRESEAKYRTLFSSIDEGFCTIEILFDADKKPLDYRFLQVNPSFERQTGIKNAVGRWMREIAPEHEERWFEIYGQVALTGEAVRFENCAQQLGHWYDVYAFRIGKPDEGRVAILFKDINDRKQSELALRESEERFRLFVTASSNMIYRMSADWREMRNLEGKNFLANTESPNLTWFEAYIPPEEQSRVWATIQAAIRTRSKFELEHRVIQQDGSIGWVFSRAIPMLNQQGEIVEWFGAGSDITERKRAEEQLRRAAEMDAFRVKLSDALRSLSDPVEIQAEACRLLGEHLGVDHAYYVEVNEAEGYARINHDYLRGDSPSLVGTFPLTEYGWVVPYLRRGETITVADTATADIVPDLDRELMAAINIKAHISLPLIKAGVLVGALCITECVPHEWTAMEIELLGETAERIWATIQRAHAEAALRESEIQRIREQAAREQERQRAENLAELDRAKTLFFSNVSHELRTPLTLSLAPLQDALSDCTHPLDPIHQERLELVHRNSLRLLKLVNTLLDFSRIEAGRVEAVYEPTDLARFTTELASSFRSAIEQAGLRLVVDCPPLPEPVYVDRQMWEKIVLNLLSNAFKFTLEGEIVVRLHPADNHQVMLEIQDTGIGIAPEHLPHLMKRFYQVREAKARTHEGTGIGLALTQELIRLHGGTIEVSSTLGQGTCFTIALPFGTDHLPCARIQATSTMASTALSATPYVEEAENWLPKKAEGRGQEAEAQEVSPTLSNARVLLVDDNADMREYLSRILSEVQVEAVADGATALAAAQARVPDLILSDIMMPGLDGFELLQALRADPRTREVPILLLSARAGEEAIVEGLQAGADDYLIKPFSAAELVSRVNAHLQMAQLRGEALQHERAMSRRKDEWLSIVTHELNAPLVAILGWTRLLRTNPSSQSMLSKALETIERNATVQANLVHDLLDISRISAGKLRLQLQPVLLKPIVENAIASVNPRAIAKNLDLKFKMVTTESFQVMGDRDRLGQVISNLLTNAVKFTPEGGQIEVILSWEEAGQSTNYAQIAVTDTGIGIPADFLPQIFDHFCQVESGASGGLGLGLAIARHLVELHQGTIRATSEGEGRGATFTIQLPLLNA